MPAMKDPSPPTTGASHTGRLLILVILTMIAFAANSIQKLPVDVILNE